MLDAAEELLAEGGPEALTVGAVVARADSSVGAFYARFGDRLGLLLAVQDRFLDRLEAAAIAQASTLVAVDDLRDVLEQLVAAFLDVFRANRNAFNAILVQNLSVRSFRVRGAQASQQGARAFAAILDACGAQVTHPDPAVAADFTFRTYARNRKRTAATEVKAKPAGTIRRRQTRAVGRRSPPSARSPPW